MMKEQLNIIVGLDSLSYLMWLESNDRYYHHRKQLLADANELFRSQRKLSELSDGERCVILGRSTRMADDAEYDVNLFGSPGASGYVNRILSSGYVHLDPFFEAIPRNGRIDNETFERLVELYKQGISDSGSPVQLFVFFTRILAVVRPDTFVSGADGLVQKISKALGIRNPGNDYKKYWTDFLPRLHEINLFSGLVGDPINVHLALIDGIGWQESDGNNVGGNQGTQKIHSPLNQILYGPPGTGKTYHTIEASVKAAEPHFSWSSRGELKAEYERLVKEKRIRFVTFHQSYGYEEFVEGLRAVSNKDNQVEYPIQSGIFKQICEDATDTEDLLKKQNYVLVIDEINRGNISKIFGELITLIEPSKRKGEKEALELTLPHSGEAFSVPNNLHIIGTMNTADRSLAMMDTALRRRFDFVEMMPKPELFAGIQVEGVDLRRMLKVLNQRIEILYDREHTLGHAFFMPVKELAMAGKQEQAFEELVSIFKNKVIPLLEEYFFEDWNKIRLVLADNQKPKDLQFVKEQIQTRQELNSLLGNKHNLDQYGQSVIKYTLASDLADVWAKPDAYVGIYQDVEEDSGTETQTQTYDTRELETES